MSERNASRPWTEYEDDLLRVAVATVGLGCKEDWKSVATMVPNRDNKACRKRWKHSLDPSVRKVPWTSTEDELLKNLYNTHGPKWSVIARHIPGRTDDACSKRYQQALDPKFRKGAWTDEEVTRLVAAHSRFGSRWAQVSAELGRASLDCRNKWRSMTTSPKKKRRHSSDLMPVQDQWEPYDQNNTVEAFQQDEYSDVYAHSTEAPSEGPHQDFRGYTPVPARFDPSTAPFQSESSTLHGALVLPTLSPRSQPPQSLHQPSDLSTPALSSSNSSQPNSDGKTSLFPPPMYGQDFQGLSVNTFDMFANHPHNSIHRPDSYPPLDFNNFSIPDLPDFIMGPWEPRGGIIPDFQDSPLSTVSQLNDEFSSASSTPFTMHSTFSPLTSTLHFSPCTITTPQISPFTHEAQLSPVSSPNPETIVDLPNTGASPNSLLFSQPGTPTAGIISDSTVSNDTVNDVARRARKAVTRKTKQPIIKAFSAARLSSLLPLGNDPNLRPYACGRPQCWPPGETTSSSCFSTSGELLEHCKEEHPGDEAPSDKPYRCALPGCGRTWKSINGLQYHLQISTVHFTNELYSRFSAQQPPSTPEQTTSPLLSTDAELEGSEPERKFTCPRPGCFKAYRQPSGLRYHVKFGHPADMPAQLSIVPPALEKQIPKKAKKLRAKPLEEAASATVGS